jgi:hypothetical protein
MCLSLQIGIYTADSVLLQIQNPTMKKRTLAAMSEGRESAQKIVEKLDEIQRI